jgi:hypothetical protein
VTTIVSGHAACDVVVVATGAGRPAAVAA